MVQAAGGEGADWSVDAKLGGRCVPCSRPRSRPLRLLTLLWRWLRVYTAKELQQHTSPDDCWLVIKGKVYDVSGWGQDHPGGAVVYTYGGKVLWLRLAVALVSLPPARSLT